MKTARERTLKLFKWIKLKEAQAYQRRAVKIVRKM